MMMTCTDYCGCEECVTDLAVLNAWADREAIMWSDYNGDPHRHND